MTFSAAQSEISAQKGQDGNRAQKLITEADVLFRQKQYRQAADKYTEVVSLAPNNAYAIFWKGYSHFHLGEYDEAKQSLDKAFSLGYKPLDVYTVRWEVNYNLGNYDAAMQDVRAGMLIRPNDSYFQFAAANIYRGQKNYREALEGYKKLAQNAPNDADLQYFIALTSYHLGDYTEQGRAAAEAIKKNTKYPGEAWFYAGDAFQKAKKDDEAIDAYERAIIANTKSYETYSNLAALYQSKSRLKEAISTVHKALRVYPEDGRLYTNLAWYYSLSDNPAEAVRAGQKAIQYSPNDSVAYTNLCRAYNDTKLYQQAINTCQKALELKPGDGESNFYIGRAYAFLNKKDLAAEYYKKAVEGLQQLTQKTPDNADNFYLLGNAYYSNGQIDEAIQAYRKVLELNPQFTKALYNLGFMYFLKGDKLSAEQQVAELSKIDKALGEKLRQAIQE